jgi:hypothetical protein
VPVDLGGERDRCYVPGKPPDQLTLADVEMAIRAGNRQYTALLLGLVPDRVAAVMTHTYDCFAAQLGGVTFRSLVEDAAGAEASPAATK